MVPKSKVQSSKVAKDRSGEASSCDGRGSRQLVTSRQEVGKALHWQLPPFPFYPQSQQQDGAPHTEDESSLLG